MSEQTAAYDDITSRETLDRLMSPEGGAAIIDFWAPWCGPCRAMAPHFEAVAKAFADEPVAFYKINTEAHPDLGKAFQVRSLPTTLVILNGEISDVHIGRMNAAKIEDIAFTALSKVRGDSFVKRLFGLHKKRKGE